MRPCLFCGDERDLLAYFSGTDICGKCAREQHARAKRGAEPMKRQGAK